MHSLEIDYRRLGSTVWWRQNYDVTENHGAARSLQFVCSKGHFSNQNINVVKEQKLFKKTEKKVRFHCLWINRRFPFRWNLILDDEFPGRKQILSWDLAAIHFEISSFWKQIGHRRIWQGCKIILYVQFYCKIKFF